MPYIPHTPADTAAMLETIGVSSIADLFADIPLELCVSSLALPPGKDEMTVCAILEDLARANRTAMPSLLGAGFYDHYIPRSVDSLAGRGEFFTAYTPYQAEASQGTLQAIFEFQTVIARLLGMECANASVYDGGSALFEAVMMAARITKRRHFVIDSAINPFWRAMLATSTKNLDLCFTFIAAPDGLSNMEELGNAIDGTTGAVVVQNPNFFGSLADYSSLFSTAHERGALGILSVNPVLQAIIKTAGEMDADIAVAEGQSLGQPLSFGGPYLGVMACKKAYVRQLPGRLVGRTTDSEGREGYVLTLQAREQHIRRSKATSNICSNQALCALRALMHLSLLGTDGLQRVAETSLLRAREAASLFFAHPGVCMLNEAPFGYEFAVRLPANANDIVQAGVKRGVLLGLPLGTFYAGMDNALLVACTEKTSDNAMREIKIALNAILGDA